MIANLGLTLLAILGLTSIASTALAQGNTFNPYGNSGYADYREFGNPMYSNNPALPGQALLNSQPFINRPRANNFQQYAEDLDGVEIDRATPSRGGVLQRALLPGVPAAELGIQPGLQTQQYQGRSGIH
jgi:hypothetical protein